MFLMLPDSGYRRTEQMWLAQEARRPGSENHAWRKSESGQHCGKIFDRILRGSAGQEESGMLLGLGPHFEK